jgi:hypothetical protein
MKSGGKHAGPSAASLREMPELPANAKGRANPYAARIAREGYTINVTRGRPRKGTETGPTHTRSVRFPDAVWNRLELTAKAKHLTVHAALRTAVLQWMEETSKR